MVTCLACNVALCLVFFKDNSSKHRWFSFVTAFFFIHDPIVNARYSLKFCATHVSAINFVLALYGIKKGRINTLPYRASPDTTRIFSHSFMRDIRVSAYICIQQQIMYQQAFRNETVFRKRLSLYMKREGKHG